jgi:hypothetical protein
VHLQWRETVAEIRKKVRLELGGGLELEKVRLKLENASFGISHGKIKRTTETHLI